MGPQWSAEVCRRRQRAQRRRAGRIQSTQGWCNAPQSRHRLSNTMATSVEAITAQLAELGAQLFRKQLNAPRAAIVKGFVCTLHDRVAGAAAERACVRVCVSVFAVTSSTYCTGCSLRFVKFHSTTAGRGHMHGACGESTNGVLHTTSESSAGSNPWNRLSRWWARSFGLLPQGGKRRHAHKGCRPPSHPLPNPPSTAHQILAASQSGRGRGTRSSHHSPNSHKPGKKK